MANRKVRRAFQEEQGLKNQRFYSSGKGERRNDETYWRYTKVADMVKDYGWVLMVCSLNQARSEFLSRPWNHSLAGVEVCLSHPEHLQVSLSSMKQGCRRLQAMSGISTANVSYLLG